MTENLTRGIAGVGVVVVLAIGGYVGSRLGLDLSDKVDLALTHRVSAEQAQAKALDKQASYHTSEAFYQTRVDEAVEKHGLSKPELASLREPNTFYQPITLSDPKLVAPGSSLREAGLELAIVVDTIAVERRGMRTKTQQTMARVRNVGDKPLAYWIDMRSRSSDCGVRALTHYDALVLLPDETAEISVCSGSHEVEVIDMRVLELTELGAVWVDKLPPQALGLDDVAVRSHAPGSGVEVCTEMPVAEFARLLKSGDSQWEDIIDFYSRHDCDHYRWWPGYKRVIEPLAELPALADPG
jgi:hypothetical protein